ncbi:hypothetical protein [Sphingobium algorifonticola]|jgi:predicted nucleic acid-binding protein|uniref:hypothetical protein n=1 Tax=Sphingobium algorifonticola TaxID=2008318 RepID=UPI0019D225AA|nr:hypothetical protein [Sphingobium algorifonticola]
MFITDRNKPSLVVLAIKDYACATLHVPDPVRERDGLIATTAQVHGSTLVTRNVADFEATGVLILNPGVWTEQ